MDWNHSDVARLPKVVRDLVDMSGARSVWVRRTARRRRWIAAHFAPGSACPALGD